jgi:hypothetical protein
MTQGLPHHKSASFAELARRIARRHDTLHLLVYVMRQQAERSGDVATTALIDMALEHINDGDSIKLALAALLQAETPDREPGWSADPVGEGRHPRPLRERYEQCLMAILGQAQRIETLERYVSELEAVNHD